MQDRSSLYSALALVSGQRQIITIPRILVSVTGSYEAAALLAQVLYWHDKMGGRFYKSLQSWAEELSLGIKQVRTARDHLVAQGFVTVDLARAKGAPTLHWEAHPDAVLAAVEKRLAEARTEPLPDPPEADMPDGQDGSDKAQHDLPNGQNDLPNGQMDLPVGANGSAPGGKSTIQEIKQEITQDSRVAPDVVGPAPSPALVQAKAAIDYLNAVAGRSFRPTKTSLAHPAARIREGFSLDDLKRVVDNMTERWGRDPKMAVYLRPETLFGSKMQSYLQGPAAARPRGEIARVTAPAGHTVSLEEDVL